MSLLILAVGFSASSKFSLTLLFGFDTGSRESISCNFFLATLKNNFASFLDDFFASTKETGIILSVMSSILSSFSSSSFGFVLTPFLP